MGPEEEWKREVEQVERLLGGPGEGPGVTGSAGPGHNLKQEHVTTLKAHLAYLSAAHEASKVQA
eukprot:2130491-Rhodomonas_salina.1